MIKDYIAIFIGGGAGSMLRYAVQMMLHERIAAYNFPWATFAANIVGSFLIGLFYGISARFNIPDGIRLLLTVGLCGGFTTFSTFSNDNLLMLRQGAIVECLAYVCLSVLLGIGACFLGGIIVRS